MVSRWREGGGEGRSVLVFDEEKAEEVDEEGGWV